MKISYAKVTDSLYIHLIDGASVDSDEVADGVVLDYGINGAVAGIDLQRATQRSGLKNDRPGLYSLSRPSRPRRSSAAL